MEVRSIQMPEALDFALSEALKHQDPLLKAQRNQGKAKKEALEKKEQHSSRNVTRRDPVPAQIKHEVVIRDEGRCVYLRPDGKRCENRRYTQLHHLKPVSRGGENSVSNLVNICSFHHRALHAGHIPPLFRERAPS